MRHTRTSPPNLVTPRNDARRAICALLLAEVVATMAQERCVIREGVRRFSSHHHETTLVEPSCSPRSERRWRAARIPCLNHDERPPSVDAADASIPRAARCGGISRKDRRCRRRSASLTASVCHRHVCVCVCVCVLDLEYDGCSCVPLTTRRSARWAARRECVNLVAYIDYPAKWPELLPALALNIQVGSCEAHTHTERDRARDALPSYGGLPGVRSRRTTHSLLRVDAPWVVARRARSAPTHRRVRPSVPTL